MPPPPDPADNPGRAWGSTDLWPFSIDPLIPWAIIVPAIISIGITAALFGEPEVEGYCHDGADAIELPYGGSYCPMPGSAGDRYLNGHDYAPPLGWVEAVKRDYDVYSSYDSVRASYPLQATDDEWFRMRSGVYEAIGTRDLSREQCADLMRNPFQEYEYLMERWGERCGRFMEEDAEWFKMRSGVKTPDDWNADESWAAHMEEINLEGWTKVDIGHGWYKYVKP